MDRIRASFRARSLSCADPLSAYISFSFFRTCPGAVVKIPPIGNRVWATPSLRIGGSARLVRLRPHPFIPFPSSLFFAHHCDLLEPFPRLSTCWLVGLSLFNLTLIFLSFFFSSFLRFGETFLYIPPYPSLAKSSVSAFELLPPPIPPSSPLPLVLCTRGQEKPEQPSPVFPIVFGPGVAH